MKRILFLAFSLLIFIPSVAQTRVTVPYAQRDTCTLYMDIYSPATVDPAKPAVLFMFGGGFMEGDKRKGIGNWVKQLTDNGFPVVSIDYRLGLKGAKLHSLKFVKLLDNPIDMAVWDLFGATAFLLEHGAEYGINARNMVVSGSSAGAITVLQGEYEICNGGELAQILPKDFNYAGEMSFAGAIFDNHNPLRFAKEPCPLLLLHGTADKLVPYKKIAVFNLCFGGTDAIVKALEKAGWKYTAYRYVDRGHEVSTYQEYCLDKEIEFMENKVMRTSGISADILINDPSSPSPAWGKTKPKALYK